MRDAGKKKAGLGNFRNRDGGGYMCNGSPSDSDLHTGTWGTATTAISVSPGHSHSVRGSWGFWFLFCLGTRSAGEGAGESSGFYFHIINTS